MPPLFFAEKGYPAPIRGWVRGIGLVDIVGDVTFMGQITSKQVWSSAKARFYIRHASEVMVLREAAENVIPFPSPAAARRTGQLHLFPDVP
jgi:hypothetical protein